MMYFQYNIIKTDVNANFVQCFKSTDSLSIDYQFTFNLSKVDDKHLTAISFKNQPTKSDVDVDFSVKCVNKGGQATNAKVNLPSYDLDSEKDFYNLCNC